MFGSLGIARRAAENGFQGIKRVTMNLPAWYMQARHFASQVGQAYDASKEIGKSLAPLADKYVHSGTSHFADRGFAKMDHARQAISSTHEDVREKVRDNERAFKRLSALTPGAQPYQM